MTETEVPVEEKYTAQMGEPDPKLYAFHVITLEKVTGVGPAPRGTVFTYSYKSLSHDEALRRAAAALEFQHKGEKREHWRLLP